MTALQQSRQRLAIVAALAFACVCPALLAAAPQSPADAQRQQQVRENGSKVMPFSLDQTRHTFEKNATGGVHSRSSDTLAIPTM